MIDLQPIYEHLMAQLIPYQLKSLRRGSVVNIARSALLVLAIAFHLIIPQASAETDLVWGANGHPFTAYPGISYERQLDYLRDLGITSYRVNIASVDPASPLRTLVDAAKARGVDILPVLTPGLDLEKDTAEELYKKAHAFAVYFVSRFKDDIRIWELGNELENFAILQPCEMRDDGVQYNCKWGPAGGVGPLEYHGGRWAKVSAVLKGLSDGTKSIDPDIRKALGTAGWGHVGAFERMRRDGIEWDISVWHFYGKDPGWGFEQVAKFGKPIWVTEFNHPLGSQKGAVKQAVGLRNLMVRFRELKDKYGLEAAHICELLDEPYWAPSFEAHMGLVYLDKDDKGKWTPSGQKPAYCVVRSLLEGGYRLAAQSEPNSAARTGNAGPEPRRQCNLCMFDNRDASPANKIVKSSWWPEHKRPWQWVVVRAGSPPRERRHGGRLSKWPWRVVGGWEWRVSGRGYVVVSGLREERTGAVSQR